MPTLRRAQGQIGNSVFRLPCLFGARQPEILFAFFSGCPNPVFPYSHSIVAGGLPLTSYTTRLMPLISLMMRLDTLPKSE